MRIQENNCYNDHGTLVLHFAEIAGLQVTVKRQGSKFIFPGFKNGSGGWTEFITWYSPSVSDIYTSLNRQLRGYTASREEDKLPNTWGITNMKPMEGTIKCTFTVSVAQEQFGKIDLKNCKIVGSNHGGVFASTPSIAGRERGKWEHPIKFNGQMWAEEIEPHLIDAARAKLTEWGQPPQW